MQEVISVRTCLLATLPIAALVCGCEDQDAKDPDVGGKTVHDVVSMEIEFPRAVKSVQRTTLPAQTDLPVLRVMAGGGKAFDSRTGEPVPSSKMAAPEFYLVLECMFGNSGRDSASYSGTEISQNKLTISFDVHDYRGTDTCNMPAPTVVTLLVKLQTLPE